jgi:hypothetical protein
MQSREIARYIERRVPSNHVVVPHPDHPNMLLGPDVIIGGDGRLSAIFVLRGNDSLMHLRAKLISARLILPLNTRMVLYLSSDRSLSYDLEVSFDVIARARQRRLLLPTANQDQDERVRVTDLIAVRRDNNARAAAILQIVDLRGKEVRSARRLKSVTRSLQGARTSDMGQNRIASELVLRRRQAIVAVVSGTVVTPIMDTGQSFRSRASSVLYAGLVGTFTLDNGVPYPDSLRPHIALVPKIPQSRVDPAKPSRACAFAGWALIASQSAEDVSEVAERLQRFFEKIK